MASASKKTEEVSRLTRDDWLDAAFKAVVEGGFDNARVLVIAGQLGVTRGSFYWHFQDHADLIASLLARWRSRELTIENQLREQTSADPQADLERLLEAALSHAGKDMENVRFELALRSLGRRDEAVAKMLLEVDKLRMGLFEEMFQRLTGNATSASELASLFYLTIVGSYQALGRPKSSPQAREYFKGIISNYLIRRQAPPRPAE